MARLWNGSRATLKQQWAHLCWSETNYLLRFLLVIRPRIDVIISPFSYPATFSVNLRFKLAQETYFMPGPENARGDYLHVAGSIGLGYRIRIAGIWDLGSGTTLTQTMIALSQAIHCFHRFQSNSFDHLKTSISRILTKSNFFSNDNSLGKPCVICHWLS